MQRTVYLPDNIDKALDAFPGHLNVSALLQKAVLREIAMYNAVTGSADLDQAFEKITVHSASEDREVGFHGRAVGRDPGSRLTVFLTRKGQFLVDDRANDEYSIHPDFDDLADNANIPGRLTTEVARSLGISYVEELDI